MSKKCPCGKSPDWFNCICKYPVIDQIQFSESCEREKLWNKFYTEFQDIKSKRDTHDILWFRIQAIVKPIAQPKIFFMTINPKPDIDLKLFKDLVSKYISRSFVKNVLYSFEQTGVDDDSMGHHPHVHIIMDKVKNMSPKQLQDRTYNTFKNVCNNRLCCDVRIYQGSLRQDKIDYLKGLKWDESKDKASKINIVWRKLNNLETI